MKRLLVLLSLLFTSFTYADTINLHWLNEDGTTYQNSTCVIDSDLILPSTPPTKYGYTFTGWKIANYIPIEYLELMGTQYINTGVIGHLGTLYEITATPTDHSFGHSYILFGSRTSATSNNITTKFTYDHIGGFTSINQDFGSYLVSRQIVEGSFTDKKITMRNSKSERSVYDWSTGTNYVTTTSYDSYITTPTNLFIGSALAGNENNAENFRGKIYSCKIYENNTLLCDFIPVLDANGTPCMFDRVEGKFYYNQGTGNFIAGPVLQ